MWSNPLGQFLQARYGIGPGQSYAQMLGTALRSRQGGGQNTDLFGMPMPNFAGSQARPQNPFGSY
jgi:hypothetical protein